MENDLVKAKKSHRDALIKKGINPYPYKYKVTDYAAALTKEFTKLKNEEKGRKVSVSGRVMAKRSFGAIAFMKIRDSTGDIQFFLKKGETKKDAFDLLDLIDVGDIIGSTGPIYKTQKGQLSVLVDKLEVLTKSVLPLPEKFHGLTDIEIRQRKRYLDLIMNPEVKEKFAMRTEIVSAWREFFNKNDFLEVEIPVLQPVYGGANARPYVTQSNAWKSKFYLSISPELYLKKLVVGGYEKVYTVCKNFRNEDVDKTHNPEFTMSEYYAINHDLEDVMKLTEDAVEFVAKKVLGTTEITYQGQKISLKAPWKRIKMIDALNKKAKIKAEKMSLAELLDFAKREGIEIDNDKKKKGLVIQELFEHFCEEDLIQPCFITEHPKETTPLCKPSREDPKNLIERAEGYIFGWELCNMYSEMNDPLLQRQVFEEQAEQGRSQGEHHPIDEDFLEAMSYGMPPAGGVGLGIDRLVMLLTDLATIRDVIFFPQMKPEHIKDKTGKEKETKMAVAVLNKSAKMERWQEMNAIAHLNAAFAARIGKELFYADSMETKDGKEIKFNIQQAIMIKEAKTNSDIIDLLKKAKKLHLDVSEFVKEMIETSDDKKLMDSIATQKHKDVNYLGALIFGDKAKVEALTKEFKLVK